MREREREREREHWHGVHTQHKQWVWVTWINASFGHEGTAGEQARLTRTIEEGRGDRKKEGAKQREGARGIERGKKEVEVEEMEGTEARTKGNLF